MQHPAAVAAAQAEAFRILAHPESVIPFTADEIERARQDMLAVARARGVDMDAARTEIEAVLASVPQDARYLP